MRQQGHLVLTKATEVAALPSVSDAQALRDTLARMDERMDTLSATVTRIDATLTAQQATLTALQATLTALQATLTAQQATLTAQQATLARLDRRSAVALNAACGEGAVRRFVPVPNDAGQLPAQLVQTAAQFRSLWAASVTTLADFYGVGPETATTTRKDRLKHTLSFAFP